MIVTAGMIEACLERTGLHGVRIDGSKDCVVEQVRRYSNKPCASRSLYLAPLGTRYRKPKAGQYALAVLPGSLGDESECAPFYDILRSLDRWDAQLKDALIDERPVSELADIGASILPHPFALFDANLNLLMKTSEYVIDNQDPDSNVPPAFSAENLLLDEDYHDAAQKTDPFYYHDANGLLYYCVNFHFDGTYTARLVTRIQDSERLNSGEEQLVTHFASYISRALAYSRGLKSMGSKYATLRQLFRTLCEQPGAVPDADLAAYLTPCGWNATDNLLVVIFALEKNAPWNSAASYLGRQLERTLSGTVALTQPQEITWIVNLSLMQRSNTPKREAIACVSKTISDLCRDYACKAGESRPFSTVTSLHAHREEARMALELGGTIDPSLWHYRFADYSLAHLLRYGTGTLEKHQLCHPALLDLIRHDEQNGTEYARTLASFLRNNQSPTPTAKALFIHRTSLLRRIERINKITALHLDDPDEVLHLLLSARLLNL